MSKKPTKKSFFTQLHLWQKITFGSISVLLLSISIFLLLSFSSIKQPQATARAAMQSTPQVAINIDSQKNITFTSLQNTNENGIIIYTGAYIEPAAYAPLANQLAAQGYLVIVPKFTLNLSIINDSEKTQRIIAQYPHIKSWTGIGHSLGGVAASNVAANHPQIFSNLILLGSYPNQPSINQYPGKMAILNGDKDYILNQKKYKKSLSTLPNNAVQVTLPGGNHAQFGDYGLQKGDGIATISQEKQQAAVIETLQIITGTYVFN